MHTQRIDITGQTFGALTVEGFTGQDYRRRATWRCRCRCGALRECAGAELRTGRVRACRGCARGVMAEAVREGAGRRKALRSNDPAKILPLLTPEQRARYERWDENCRRLNVYVAPAERLQVLKEIAA